jgi:hypothetical protein
MPAGCLGFGLVEWLGCESGSDGILSGPPMIGVFRTDEPATG